jgi:predicted cobalt transporter CbtA
MSSSNASSSSSLASTAAAYTGPETPVILPEEDYNSGRPSSSRAFLGKTPAPGSSIEVRTHAHEYQIWAKLPGFTWDGITLATQKRRVLHIVADKWDHNGGGF